MYIPTHCPSITYESLGLTVATKPRRTARSTVKMITDTRSILSNTGSATGPHLVTPGQYVSSYYFIILLFYYFIILLFYYFIMSMQSKNKITCDIYDINNRQPKLLYNKYEATCTNVIQNVQIYMCLIYLNIYNILFLFYLTRGPCTVIRLIFEMRHCRQYDRENVDQDDHDCETRVLLSECGGMLIIECQK